MIDNPVAPGIAHCDQAGCPNTHTIAADTRRAGEQELADHGWYWEADYSSIRTYCPTHASQPVRRRRGGG